MPRDPYVQVPQFFLRDLTPDQYRAQLEIYQRAYQAAQEKLRQPKPFVPPFEFEQSDGI
jgi:hypothetical protein